MTYDQYKLQTPSHFADEVDEIETEEISNPLDEILDITARLKKYDRKEIEMAFKILLNFAQEPGNKLEDVHELLNKIIEEI